MKRSEKHSFLTRINKKSLEWLRNHAPLWCEYTYNSAIYTESPVPLRQSTVCSTLRRVSRGLLCLTWLTCLTMENDRVNVHVHEGELIGIVEKSVYGHNYISFRGIPYAKPPIGELRFKVNEQHFRREWHWILTRVQLTVCLYISLRLKQKLNKTKKSKCRIKFEN